MAIPVLRDALDLALAECRDECARAVPAARLLNLLWALRPAYEGDQTASAIAGEWGHAMADQMPSEDELLWLGGIWLATAHRIFGAESETSEALGQLFAAAAERALLPSNSCDATGAPGA